LEVLSELVLSEVGSERADFVTGDIPGAVAKVTSACRYRVVQHWAQHSVSSSEHR
jgi:hypothetical protein